MKTPIFRPTPVGLRVVAVRSGRKFVYYKPWTRETLYRVKLPLGLEFETLMMTFVVEDVISEIGEIDVDDLLDIARTLNWEYIELDNESNT